MWAKNCKEHAKEQWRTNLLDSDTIVLKCTQIGQTDNLSFGFKHYFSKKNILLFIVENTRKCMFSADCHPKKALKSSRGP
jgi:hypothetical protein